MLKIVNRGDSCVIRSVELAHETRLTQRLDRRRDESIVWFERQLFGLRWLSFLLIMFVFISLLHDFPKEKREKKQERLNMFWFESAQLFITRRDFPLPFIFT